MNLCEPQTTQTQIRLKKCQAKGRSLVTYTTYIDENLENVPSAICVILLKPINLKIFCKHFVRM